MTVESSDSEPLHCSGPRLFSAILCGDNNAIDTTGKASSIFSGGADGLRDSYRILHPREGFWGNHSSDHVMTLFMAGSLERTNIFYFMDRTIKTWYYFFKDS